MTTYAASLRSYQSSLLFGSAGRIKKGRALFPLNLPGHDSTAARPLAFPIIIIIIPHDTVPASGAPVESTNISVRRNYVELTLITRRHSEDRVIGNSSTLLQIRRDVQFPGFAFKIHFLNSSGARARVHFLRVKETW